MKCYDFEARDKFMSEKRISSIEKWLAHYNLTGYWRSLPEKAYLEFADTFVFEPSTTYESVRNTLTLLGNKYRR